MSILFTKTDSMRVCFVSNGFESLLTNITTIKIQINGIMQI